MCSSIFISTAITRKNIKTISCKNPYIYIQRENLLKVIILHGIIKKGQEFA